jgi:hypothetical protein
MLEFADENGFERTRQKETLVSLKDFEGYYVS